MNKKNLTHINEREDFKELVKKGGIASGKARRRKADLRKRMQALLETEVVSDNLKQQLQANGLNINNEDLLVFSIFQKALKGNQKAVENIIKVLGVKDKYDIQEQKARIKNINKDTNTEKMEVIFVNENNIQD